MAIFTPTILWYTEANVKIFLKGGVTTDTLILHWQPLDQGARLVRVQGERPLVRLPAQVEGRILREIGPYCFSATPPQPQGPVYTTRLGEDRPVTDLAGNFLREVALPAQAELLNSAAFYNCRKLETLRVGSQLRQTGSDLFSNCFALTRLEMDARGDDPTGLRKLLAAFPGDLEVVFQDARLFYPEYDEELDESAPAHIFSRTISGEGYRYRQCFAGDVVSFGEYDATFLREKAQEQPKNMCRLALGRLEHPLHLAPAARQAYLEYLTAQAGTALSYLTGQGDVNGINFFLGLGIASPAALEEAQDLALKKGLGEISALLLDWQHRLFAPKKKTYDFDF